MKTSQLILSLTISMVLFSPVAFAKSGVIVKPQIPVEDLPEIAAIEKAESCAFVKDKKRSLKSENAFVFRGKDKEKKTVCTGRITCNMIPNSMSFDTESPISCGFAEANKACDARECLIQYVKDRQHLDAQLKSFEKPKIRASSDEAEELSGEGKPPR